MSDKDNTEIYAMQEVVKELSNYNKQSINYEGISKVIDSLVDYRESITSIYRDDYHGEDQLLKTIDDYIALTMRPIIDRAMVSIATTIREREDDTKCN